MQTISAEPTSNTTKKMIKITLNEAIVITNISPAIRDEVTRHNTFHNPKLRDAKKYGRSTWNLPAYIKTYKLNCDDLIVHRGFCHDLIEFLKDKSEPYEIDDQRICPPADYPVLNGITLRPYQDRVIEEAKKHSQGVLCCPTGSGKSILGCELIRAKKTTALIMVHKKELAEQWKNLIEKVFGFTPSMIGDGSWDESESITIATVQTLSRYEEKTRKLNCGLVLLDECHHAPAEQFAKVINWLPAKYRYGLSATLNRRDMLDFLIFRSLGPVIASVSKYEVEAVKSIVPAVVKVIKTGFNPGLINGWQRYIRSLNNMGRNLTILRLIPADESVLILTDRVVHAEEISRMLTVRKIDNTLAHGELQAEQRATLMQRIKGSRITVGTTSLLGEGLDVSSWSVLILASPISSEAKLMQAIGRVVPPLEGKKVGLVYDLHDDHGFSGSSLKNRRDIYEKHGIEVQFIENDKIS